MSDDAVEGAPGSSAPFKESTEDLINQLENMVSEDLHRCLKQVVSDYQQKDCNVNNLNGLLLALNKFLKDRETERPEKQKDEGRWYQLTSMTSMPSMSSMSFLKTSVKVKVFPVVAAKTYGADTQILKKVDVDVCSSPADCDVVVVFCPVTSRVGSDVDDAMRNIPGGASGKNVILLIMHHSRKDISPAQVQLNHGHQNVIQDIHVVYHETAQGLIKCRTNNQALQTLKDWCKAFTP